jgi:hypothetical protein
VFDDINNTFKLLSDEVKSKIPSAIPIVFDINRYSKDIFLKEGLIYKGSK